MNDFKEAYLSIGSNIGNRIAFLQQAEATLERYPIQITALSSIYESPAWGFESTPFLNACLKVSTELNPRELLDVLLNIEVEMGRERKQKQGYQERRIDLDILFYDNAIICEPDLEIPHPRLELRNFVLVPLAEIAPELVHPVLKKRISELVDSSTDTSQLTPLDFNLWSPPIFEKFPYIVIEGNIGAGKTTLTERLADHYQVPPLYEAFAKNPHLEDFYQNPEAEALAVETFFLEDRYQSAIDFWKRNKQQPAVADYSIYKSLIFAEQNLSTQNLIAYKMRFQEIIRGGVAPDLMLYLRQPIPKLLENIRQRGRTFEQKISPKYLQKIADGYLNFLKQTPPFPILEIDAASFDFRSDTLAFQKLLRKINAVEI